MDGVRPAKITKEIEVAELEQLTNPEARATATFDAAELQALVDQTLPENDARRAVGPQPIPEPAPRSRSLVPYIALVLIAALALAAVLWSR